MPALAGDRAARREHVVAFGEDVLRIALARDGVRDVIAIRDDVFAARRVDVEIAAHETRDPFPAVGCDGGDEPQQAWLGRHVPLPTDDDDAEAVAHQEPVAQIVRYRGVA